MEDRRELIDKFLSELKSLKLTGREFLAIIGNTKISNEAYNEIKTNHNLTHSGLAELFFNSELTTQDFIKVLHSARGYNESKKRKQREASLVQAVAVAEQRLSPQLSDVSTLKIKVPRPSHEEVIPEENKIDDYGEYDEEYTEYDEYEEYEEEEYEDDAEYDEYDEQENYLTADAFDDDENNNGRIALMAVFAVLLVALSFFIRERLTGSLWIVNIDNLTYERPLSYKDLSMRFYNMESFEHIQPINAQKTTYYLSGETPAVEFEKTEICYNNDYIFKIHQNALYALKVSGGILRERKIVRPKETDTLSAVFLHNERLYAVSEGEYVGSYSDSEPIVEDNDDVHEQLVSGTFTQSTITVMMFDAIDFTGEPLAEITIDGSFNDIVKSDDTLFVVSDYAVKNPAAHNDLAAYIPHVQEADEERRPLKLENIFIPLNYSGYSNMVVVTAIMPDGETLSRAFSGGKKQLVEFSGNSLFIVQNEDNKARIIRMPTWESADYNYFEVDGTMDKGMLDESDSGIIRVVATTSSRSNLYIYDDELKKLSTVTGILSGEVESVLYERSYVYIIGNTTEGEAELTYYVIETSIPDKPLIATEGFGKILVDTGYFWSEELRLSFEPVFEDDGLLVSYVLSMRNAADGEPIASITLRPEDYVLEQGVVELKETQSIYYFPEMSAILVPMTYSNGVSLIEKFVLLLYNESTGFSTQGKTVHFDLGKTQLDAAVLGNYAYTFHNDMLVTADMLTGRIVRSYNNFAN